MIFDIIEEKLRNSLLLIPSETLFRNYMPPEVTTGAMVRVPLEGIAIDPNMSNYYRGKMQVITRDVDPTLGLKLASDISRILTVMVEEKFLASDERGAASIKIFFPETLPIRFPRLEGNGFEWSQTFCCAFSFEPI